MVDQWHDEQVDRPSRCALEAGLSWPLPIDLSDDGLKARLYPVERERVPYSAAYVG